MTKSSSKRKAKRAARLQQAQTPLTAQERLLSSANSQTADTAIKQPEINPFNHEVVSGNSALALMSGPDATAERLTAVGLRKSYQDRLVVNDVNIEVQRGEVVGLLGPNGAGKTTSFYIILGLIKPDAGKVSIGDADLTEMPVYMRSRNGIGYLPQESSIFRNLTVRQNLDLVFQEIGYPAKDATDTLMEQFGITKLANTKGYALSGGERRRVEIARAMTLKPRFILLDEPFSGIDPIAVNDIQEMLFELKKHGYGILVTDHNVRETLSITDRTYLIYDGKIMLNGSPTEMMNNPLARKFYLGNDFSW